MLLLQRILNLLFIYVLLGVLFGARLYQIFTHEAPCPLCLLQQLSMIAITIALLMNLRFGIKMEHYGLAILSAIVGRMVSLKQITLHLCPELSPFGEPVLGFSLYVWAFIIFTCSIFAVAILLILYGYAKQHNYPPTWGLAEKMAFGLITLITLANLLTTIRECGFSSC